MFILCIFDALIITCLCTHQMYCCRLHSCYLCGIHFQVCQNDYRIINSSTDFLKIDFVCKSQKQWQMSTITLWLVTTQRWSAALPRHTLHEFNEFRKHSGGWQEETEVGGGRLSPAHTLITAVPTGQEKSHWKSTQQAPLQKHQNTVYFPYFSLLY